MLRFAIVFCCGCGGVEAWSRLKGQVNGLASPADWRVGCGRILVTLEWIGGRVVHLCRYYSGLLEAVDGWIRDGVFMLWGRCVYLPCLGSSLRDICVVNTVESLPNKRTDATALLMPWRNTFPVIRFSFCL
ncbi:uncharacterized protein LOC123500994 [Portunus trituberculatus]|uniref:uncharacterized protein LOC123500994 n=1 Tax=Portunus trituberculatus TaxID=210409 RepID=UPI001E1CDB20|nr:uncharacterized protein LOC123500994 [Portunus trituberculatus]